MAMPSWGNSTFYDLTSYRSIGGVPTGLTNATFPINVGLVLDRANDPTALLNSNWATRERTLQQLETNGTLWSTYGASTANYNAAMTYLTGQGFKILGQGGDGYISSQQDRTIWVQISNAAQWQALFGPTLQSGTTPDGQKTLFWNGTLSLPQTLLDNNVKGLLLDTTQLQPILPDPGTGQAVSLPGGPQSIGNYAGEGTGVVLGAQTPQAMAALYDFPLQGTSVQTPSIAVIEPGLGTVSPSSTSTFSQLLTQYLKKIGVNATANVQGVQPGGTFTTATLNTNPVFWDERALDASILAAVDPTSQQVLYAGSGTSNSAKSNAWTAYQSAIFQNDGSPVISSSFGGALGVSSPDSPFLWAEQQIFIDAALSNLTLLTSSGDQGAGYAFANGLANVSTGVGSPFDLIVGGTSLSVEQIAAKDPTLNSIVQNALGGNLATLWQLVQSGMMLMPTANSPSWLIETVWNEYVYTPGQTSGAGTLNTGYLGRASGTGGVDSAESVPNYQRDFGLASGPQALTSRGTPDVSAPAGGNSSYKVADGAMGTTSTSFIVDEGGTSAATPFWASLMAQIDAVFLDQGLPPLGYVNDLLYIAAAIEPATFNDDTMGNNISSYVLGGTVTSNSPNVGSNPPSVTGTAITPTGQGYYAGPGYDLATGLGSPNGLLLARTLSTIAHEQMYFGNEPNLVNGDNTVGWTSGAYQNVLLQTMSGSGATIGVNAGSANLAVSSGPTATYAWTSRFAEDVLQPNFDPNLVTLFDKQSQGSLSQANFLAGQNVSVSVNGNQAQATEAQMTSGFGIADFSSPNAVERLARPVAIAETAGAQDNATVVARLRQVGEDNTTLTFYRVDDLAGDISGLQPGAPGYAAAAQARAYQLSTGGTSIGGLGYGNFAQTDLLHVNAGDLIAMTLTNNTHGNTFWAFSQANEVVNGQAVGHLWNYGANVWGWEDTFGGGDRDYNDMLVGLDFTSASGKGLLA